MTQAQLDAAAEREAAKVAARFDAAKKIRAALDAAAEVLGDDFDEDEIFALVTEDP